MSSSTHQIVIKGKDSTAGAFRSIESRAAAAGSRISKIVGGAVAAAGAYLSVKAFTGAAQELGKLSDIAQKTGTSVDDLTRSTAAFRVLGVNMGTEQFAKALFNMQRTLGRSGMEGLYKTVDDLGKIPDAAKRAQLAMQIFGRSGAELMPLIEAAEGGTKALQTVMAAMPSVPQSAADAGDAVADAMDMAATEVKSIWLQAVGKICEWFDGMFAGGIREATAAACNWVENRVKKMAITVVAEYRRTQEYLKRFGAAAGSFVGALAGGGTLSDAIDMASQSYAEEVAEYKEASAEIDRVQQDRLAREKKRYEERAEAVKLLGEAYKKAARAPRANGNDPEKAAQSAAERTVRIANQLMKGGSGAQLRLELLGPQYQNEQKKQTSLLEKIADNTAKAAEANDGEMVYPVTDVGA